MLHLHPNTPGTTLDRCKVCNMPVGVLRHTVTLPDNTTKIHFHITCVDALLVDYAQDWELRDKHSEQRMKDSIERG